MISSAFRYHKSKRTVLGRNMAYVDAGQGDPIVLLHGNPTSSYLWRNVIPYLVPLGRCIAPDLIGMGDSDKLPDSGPTSYTFAEHRQYLDELLAGLGIREHVTLVVHDWGSALGFDWANRHRAAVDGIAHMEAIVLPRTWDDFPEPIREFQMALRSAAGERMILEQNLFVERVLRAGVLRQLSDAEMAMYRQPFATPGEGRRPTLSWPRQIPVDGDPADVTAIVADYADWLRSSGVPKLLINGEPGGAAMTGRFRDFCRTWPAQEELKVAGVHFLQEDSPYEIGQAVATWMRGLRVAT